MMPATNETNVRSSSRALWQAQTESPDSFVRYLTDRTGLLASMGVASATFPLFLCSLGEEDSRMLPPFIIEQIRKREEEERRRYEQPQLDLPLAPPGPAKRREDGDENGQRGVIIVEL